MLCAYRPKEHIPLQGLTRKQWIMLTALVSLKIFGFPMRPNVPSVLRISNLVTRDIAKFFLNFSLGSSYFTFTAHGNKIFKNAIYKLDVDLLTVSNSFKTKMSIRS